MRECLGFSYSKRKLIVTVNVKDKPYREQIIATSQTVIKSQNIGSVLGLRWRKKLPSKGLRNEVVNLFPQNVNDYLILAIQTPGKISEESEKESFWCCIFNIREA